VTEKKHGPVTYTWPCLCC